jgi:glycosyltransferase involved in cell wall biosynthesis
MVQKKLGLTEPVLWVHCPAACDMALRMKKRRLVYLRTDRYEEFPHVDAKAIGEYDKKLKSQADLTIFVNGTLYEAEAADCRKAIYLDHGVDYELFAGAASGATRPPEMADIAKPIVGFFGGIDAHTFDMELMERVVELLPEMFFVFVGKSSMDCSRLVSKANVKMTGQKPYHVVAEYGKCFDVAIMPWRQNRWIEGCNPIKLKEYLALGKPVVSTSFPELDAYRDIVYEASGPEQFAGCIRKAIREDNATQTAARRAKVQYATWESKAQLVMAELFNGNTR